MQREIGHELEQDQLSHSTAHLLMAYLLLNQSNVSSTVRLYEICELVA